jgi:protein-S-isoprenylcysteine O-methyltransferase Ste14
MHDAETLSLNFIALIWAVWCAVWFALSLGVKPAVRHESRVSRLLHLVPLGIAILLLIAGHRSGALLARNVLPQAPWMAAAGAALTLLGLLFAGWARLVLGRNWSGTVTVKLDHELVRAGPYALARHPIYTGLLTALLGTALAIDKWRAAAAFVIVTLSFLRKLRTEEAFMSAQFGAAYDAYRAEVPALVPRIWARSE